MSSDEDVADAVNVEEAAQAAEEADKGVTANVRRFAYVYLTVLFSGIAAAIVLSIFFGFLEPNLVLTGEVSVGWIVEYLVLGLVAIFLTFTALMMFVALPGSIIGGAIRIAGGIGQAYLE